LIYIYRYSKLKGTAFVNKNKILLRWLKLLAATISTFIFLQTVQYLSLFFKGDFSVFAQIGQSTSLILMKSYCLLNPLVMENMDGCIDNQLEENDHAISNQTIKLLPTPNANFLGDKYFTELQNYLITNKAYLNPNITISIVSIDVGINKNKLSTLIQQYYSTNFAELINRLRIHYFIELVKENKNLTMETLIYDSGFTHRSTFYAAFKKHIGINPTTYLKEYNSFEVNKESLIVN
jgi:AraC-like DNA-binding protein